MCVRAWADIGFDVAFDIAGIGADADRDIAGAGQRAGDADQEQMAVRGDVDVVQRPNARTDSRRDARRVLVSLGADVDISERDRTGAGALVGECAADRDDDHALGGVGLDRETLVGFAEHVGKGSGGAIGGRGRGAIDKRVGGVEDGDICDGETDASFAADRQRAGNSDDVRRILGDHAQIAVGGNVGGRTGDRGGDGIVDHVHRDRGPDGDVVAASAADGERIDRRRFLGVDRDIAVTGDGRAGDIGGDVVGNVIGADRGADRIAIGGNGDAAGQGVDGRLVLCEQADIAAAGGGHGRAVQHLGVDGVVGAVDSKARADGGAVALRPADGGGRDLAGKRNRAVLRRMRREADAVGPGCDR